MTEKVGGLFTLSRNDAKYVAYSGVAAMGLGLGYAVVQSVLSKNARTRPLDPETEALQDVMPDMYDLMIDLENYKYVDPIRFSRAVEAIDRYAFLFGQIGNEVIVPNTHDYKKLTTDYSIFMTKLEKMVEIATKDPSVPPQDAIAVQRLYREIFEEMKKTHKRLVGTLRMRYVKK